MFMGLGQFTGLINPAAISLLNTNAYNAAKVVLGPKTSSDILFKAADDYVAFVKPKTNRALTTFEIEHDLNFKRIAAKAKESGIKDKAIIGKGDLVDTGDYGLTGSIFGSIPNYLIYGGVGIGAYMYYKKKKGGGGKLFNFFKKKSKRSSRRSSRRISAAPVGVMA